MGLGARFPTVRYLFLFLLAFFLFALIFRSSRKEVPRQPDKVRETVKKSALLEETEFTEWEGNRKLFTLKGKKVHAEEEEVVVLEVAGELFFPEKLSFQAKRLEYQKRKGKVILKEAILTPSSFTLKSPVLQFDLRKKHLQGERVQVRKAPFTLKADSFSAALPLRKIVLEGNTVLQEEKG